MLRILLLLCLLIWLPILFYQIDRRAFVVLITWLFIGPVVSNLVNRPGSNPFFQTPVVQAMPWGGKVKETAYVDLNTTITLRDLLEPTRILLCAFLLVFLLDILLLRKRQVPLDRTEMWMGVFCIILVASAVVQSVRIPYSLHTACDAFIIPFLGYFTARRLVASEDRLRKFIQVIGYMACYLIIIGLVEYAMAQNPFHRLRGPSGSTDVLYIIISVAFFMVILDSVGRGDLPQERRALPWVVRHSITCLAPVIIFLSWARGNWLGFLLAVGLFLFLGRQLIGYPRKLAVIGAGLLLITVVAIGAPQLVTEDLFDKRISDPGNAYGRLATWRVGIQVAIDYPIFGIGLNNSRAYLQEQGRKFMGVSSYTTLHNSLLSIFVELGAIGLLVYLAIVVSIIRMGMHLYSMGQHIRDRWRGIAIIAIMIAYQVPALFSLSLYIYDLGHIYVYVCLGGIAGLYGGPRAVQAPSLIPHPPRPMNAGMLGIPR